MWYALKEDEKIIAVRFFNTFPDIAWFETNYMSTRKYKIVPVEIIEK